MGWKFTPIFIITTIFELLLLYNALKLRNLFFVTVKQKFSIMSPEYGNNIYVQIPFIIAINKTSILPILPRKN